MDQNRLYYATPYVKTFMCTVESCVQNKKGTWDAVLNQTAFYPEGGGQPSDTGTLNGVKVLHVSEKGETIIHELEAPLEEGTLAEGVIDWQKRYDNMQQHTGEHIVSGIVHERFGYNNVGFHLGADYCTMDFDGPISKAQLKEIETEANEAVYRNLEVEVLYPSKEELKDMDYRSKIEIEGQVRIVKIPGYDVCACCAPHVKTTGEIGAVKLVSMVSYKGGERITMLCGRRAMRDYEKKDAMTKEISTMLCAKEYEVAEAVGRLKSEQTRMKSQIAELQQKLLKFCVAEIPVDEKIVTVFDGSLSGNLPREMMNQLLDKGAVICAVFAGTDEEGYRYVIGSRSEDVRSISKTLNSTLEGRGGGKPEMVQGSVKGTEDAVKEIIARYQ